MLKMHFSGAGPVLSASTLMAVEIQAQWNHFLDLSYVCCPKVGASRLSIVTAREWRGAAEITKCY